MTPKKCMSASRVSTMAMVASTAGGVAVWVPAPPE
jgi:hypothetical protein